MTATATPQQIVKKPIDTVRDLLEGNRQGIQSACTKILNADRLIRLMFVECRKNPQLAECTPASLLGAVFQMAQLGLEPGPMGLAYLVPFRNKKAGGRREVQFIPGYKGLIALARRSEQIATIQAELVYKDDKFAYTKGLNPTLAHTPNDDPKASKDIKAVYAIGGMLNGFHQFEVMTMAQVLEHKERYAKSSESLVWETEWGPKKTVLRKLCKLLPASTELQTAVALDELAEAGLSQHLGSLPELPIQDPIEAEEAEEIKDIQTKLEEKKEEKKTEKAKPAEPQQSLVEDAEEVKPLLPPEPEPISDTQWDSYIRYMDSVADVQQLKAKVKEVMKFSKLRPLIEPARTAFVNTMNDYAKKQGVLVQWPV